jgi:hypothetical protein
MRRILAIILAVVALSQYALGDRVVLKDGRTLTGTAVLSGTMVVVKGAWGEAQFAESEVKEIIREGDPAAEYEKRAAAAGVNDKRAHLELAAWCARAGMVKEEKYHLLNALRIEPEDPELRHKLGYVFYAGRWMTETQMMSAKGLVRAGREWVTPEEKARLDAAEKRAAEEARAAAEADAAESAARKRDAGAIADAFNKAGRDFRTLSARRIGAPLDWSAYLPPWWTGVYYKYKRNYPQFFGESKR